LFIREEKDVQEGSIIHGSIGKKNKSRPW